MRMRVARVLLVVLLLALIWVNFKPIAIDDKVIGLVDSVESKTNIDKEDVKLLSILSDSDNNYDVQESIDQISDLKEIEHSSVVSGVEELESLLVYEIPEEKIPTPDELFDSQQQINVDDELPATIPDMLVVSPELEELELATEFSVNDRVYQFAYEEPLPDNPDEPYASSAYMDELPASEDFEPVDVNIDVNGELPATIPDMLVVPLELEELELATEFSVNDRGYQFAYEEPLPDNPDEPYASSVYAAELPASEDFKPVFPSELE